ncbi:hypothetical protein ACQKLP_13255 [Chitinophaga sp. NPDC101104]|uniref:hypothetical protein n=1 Tax=Chitinophaga sp. NPDC101104 TaxID=3390561 RepID=UPI003D010EFE
MKALGLFCSGFPPFPIVMCGYKSNNGNKNTKHGIHEDVGTFMEPQHDIIIGIIFNFDGISGLENAVYTFFPADFHGECPAIQLDICPVVAVGTIPVYGNDLCLSYRPEPINVHLFPDISDYQEKEKYTDDI